MYQPVYGTITDDRMKGERTTSSCRGKVSRISGHVNTHFGEALNFSVDSDGELKKKDISALRNKLDGWILKGNKRWVDYYVKRIKEAEEYNKQMEDKEYVDIDIHSRTSGKFRLVVNHELITPGILELISFVYDKNWAEVINKLKQINDGEDIFQSAIAQKV